VQPPKEPDPPTVGGMIQGYRLAGKGLPGRRGSAAATLRRRGRILRGGERGVDRRARGRPNAHRVFGKVKPPGGGALWGFLP